MIQKRVIALVFGLIIVLAGAVVLPNIDVNNDFSDSFQGSSTELSTFDSLNQYFSPVAAPIIVSLSSAKGFNTFEDWKKVESLLDLMRNEFLEDSILSILDIVTFKQVNGNIFSKPLINLTGEDLYPGWEERLRSYDYLASGFVDSNLITQQVLIFSDNWTNDKTLLLEHLLEEKFDHQKEESSFIYGLPVINQQIKKQVLSDLYYLALIGFIIILTLFYIFFKSWKVILVIGFLAAINVNATILLIYIVGLEFNILTSIVPTIISILSVTDLNHVTYESSKNYSLGNRMGIAPSLLAVKRLRRTLVMTSVTTAIGFAIFAFNDVPTVRVFALISVLGIAISLMNVFLFATTFLSWIKQNEFRLYNTEKLAANVSRFVVHKYKIISVVFIFFMSAVIFFSIKGYRTDYNALLNLNRSSALYKKIKANDKFFKNLVNLELIVESSEKDLIQNAKNLFLIEKEIKRVFGSARVIGIQTFLKEFNRILHSGNEEYYELPDKLTQSTLKKLENEINNLDQIYNREKQLFKLNIQLQSLGGADLISKVDEIKKNFILSNVRFYFGGYSYFENQSALDLVDSILLGILISIVLISLITAIVLRNASYILPTLLVNLFPIVVSLILVYSLYGFLTPSIVIMLSIAFGIALDDTMYFVSKLKKTRRYESFESFRLDVQRNIERNFFPIVTTSITLSGSFCSLIFSGFEINSVNALILIVTLIIAMISDLLVLPALLLFMRKGK